MERCAIFVDAGYLFAQGSAALAGAKQQRSNIILDAPRAVAALRAVVDDRAPACSLLRIYWYDGALSGPTLTSEQAFVANLDDVKLRLGFVNSYGQQKGVDSLIVTDMIELARLQSIKDAILISGDEDVRVGVQIAQNYVVRVHLVGIIPARASQSHQLRQEADTTLEWSQEIISDFMSIRPTGPETQATLGRNASLTDDDQDGRPVEILLNEVVAAFVRDLAKTDLQAVHAFWRTQNGVPPDFDGKLLKMCAEKLGRKLENDEKRNMRRAFSDQVRSRSGV